MNTAINTQNSGRKIVFIDKTLASPTNKCMACFHGHCNTRGESQSHSVGEFPQSSKYKSIHFSNSTKTIHLSVTIFSQSQLEPYNNISRKENTTFSPSQATSCPSQQLTKSSKIDNSHKNMKSLRFNPSPKPPNLISGGC